MKKTSERPIYSLREEVANSIIHGAGALLAVAGLSVLATLASLHGSAWHIVGCCIFGACLVILYAASTLYHSISSPRAKSFLRLLDHNAIFLLIAGTYTPFTLVNLRGPWGWSLLGAIWGLAIAGIVMRSAVPGAPRFLFVGLYILMGWLVVLATKPLMASVSPVGLLLLLAGGISYTGGVAFYLWRRLPYHHAIWHGCVVAGSAFHYFAILLYVIPSSQIPASGT